mmetsp:Transcript_10694/g.17674  ORF Transcript_10694/g.17674 Transcript_10694/m.17674 type:complete len:183 (-) Transcript_10694:186-734(-)
MDRNGDGTLTVAEVKDALDQASVEIPGNIEQLLDEADTEGSGVIDYTEFLAATLDKKVYVQEDIVWNAFKKFDLDNNGSIDLKELNQVLGDAEVAEAMNLKDSAAIGNVYSIFMQVDQNHDGKIDFEELRNYLHPPSGNENTAHRKRFKDIFSAKSPGPLDYDTIAPRSKKIHGGTIGRARR